MNIDSIIYQLKTYCPILVSVAGGSEAENVQDNTNLAMPAAFVIPLSQEATPNDALNGLWQTVTESFAVLIALDNRVDAGRGQASAAYSFSTMTEALHKALLNWRLDSDTSVRGLEFNGGNLVRQDRARAWYRWVYTNEYILTEADGFQPDSTDLKEIDVTTSSNGPTFGVTFP